MKDEEKWQWFQQLTAELEGATIIYMRGKPFVLHPASPNDVEWVADQILVE